MNNNDKQTDAPLDTSSVEGKAGITIRVPASAGNFGPGFETVALAVNKYLNLTVRVQPPSKRLGIEIIAKGKEAGLLSIDNNSNLIAKVIEKVWPQDPGFLSCLSITIETEIPIAVGLGFSAAATAAGVTAALALSGMRLEKGDIFERTAKIEGHAESACASIFGGFAMSAPNLVQGDILPRKLMWPDKWCVVAVVPPYKIHSKKARATLPASVSHKDAVFNLQKMAFLIEAVAAGDDEAMRAALRDKLHEPYKSKLVPELTELRKLLQDCDVLGVVLSGSGPTVLTVLDNQHKATIIEHLEKWSASRKDPCQIIELEVDDVGIFVT